MDTGKNIILTIHSKYLNCYKHNLIWIKAHLIYNKNNFKCFILLFQLSIEVLYALNQEKIFLSVMFTSKKSYQISFDFLRY